MLLSDTKIKGIKPGGKEIRLSDGEGLSLVVSRSGGKSWRLRYRFHGREKTLSLGRYPQVSLAEAREHKAEVRKTLSNGRDPSSERKQEKALAIFRDKNSFGAVTEEWLERSRLVWTDLHGKKVRGRLVTHVLPNLGSRPIAEILPLELLSVIQEIERKGATHMAHRCLQICGLIYNYAIITGRTQHNITTGLNKALRPHVEKHQPTLSERELPEFLTAFSSLKTTEQNKLAFRLLLLTAVRTGEMRHSKWSDVDIERREWRIPAAITKMRTEHIVPLSWQVLELLEQLHTITGDSEWLLPSQQRQVNPVMSENTINRLIQRMGYKGRIVGHGFRSLFSTVLNERGFNRDAIERQLAHRERNGVRAAYNRAEYHDYRIQLMQWWADFIDSQSPSPTSYGEAGRLNIHYGASQLEPNGDTADQEAQAQLQSGHSDILLNNIPDREQNHQSHLKTSLHSRSVIKPLNLGLKFDIITER